MFALTPFRHRYLEGYDPFREFENLERRFFARSDLPDFRIDIREEGDVYILEADLPGFNKEDIRIELEGNYMTVRGERSQKEEKEEGRYLRSERSYGAVERTFDLSGVDAAALRAVYRDGVLTVTMPKKKVEQPKTHQLPIE